MPVVGDHLTMMLNFSDYEHLNCHCENPYIATTFSASQRGHPRVTLFKNKNRYKN